MYGDRLPSPQRGSGRLCRAGSERCPGAAAVNFSSMLRCPPRSSRSSTGTGRFNARMFLRPRRRASRSTLAAPPMTVPEGSGAARKATRMRSASSSGTPLNALAISVNASRSRDLGASGPGSSAASTSPPLTGSIGGCAGEDGCDGPPAAPCALSHVRPQPDGGANEIALMGSLLRPLPSPLLAPLLEPGGAPDRPCCPSRPSLRSRSASARSRL